MFSSYRRSAVQLDMLRHTTGQSRRLTRVRLKSLYASSLWQALILVDKYRATDTSSCVNLLSVLRSDPE